MAQAKLTRKPQRWDQPFGPGRLKPDVVGRLLSLPIFRHVDGSIFPDDLALDDILANDARIDRYNCGDIIYRKGTFGTSVYIVLSGAVGVLEADGENAVFKTRGAGKNAAVRAGFLGKLSGKKPTNKTRALRPLTHLARRISPFPPKDLTEDLRGPETDRQADVSQSSSTPIVTTGGLFGEAEALMRRERAQTIVAKEDGTLVLEIRWSGVRELRHWSDEFRTVMDNVFRQNALYWALSEIDLFKTLDNETCELVAGCATFEIHGDFEWTHAYQHAVQTSGNVHQIIRHESLIAEQGHYLDDMFFICAGFARVSEQIDLGERTLGYLTKGDAFGLTEILKTREESSERSFRHSLRSVGFTALLRVPAAIIEAYVLPKVSSGEVEAFGKPYDQAALDFAVDHRFINGRQSMAINTDRCVNCDDCVRACASTHGNVARFVRHGPRHQNLMIANACMHCVDPVCLIGCPTGAIGRDRLSGTVLVDEGACIGCGTCASNCPYGNISMKPAKDASGAWLIDADGSQILKASKCDLCSGQTTGPACQRACPHNALIRVDIGDSAKLTDWLFQAE